MAISDYYDGLNRIAEHNGSTDFFKLSPSSAADFFLSTRQWYGQNLLGEPKFEGSDSTVIGNIVHYFAEQASLRLKPENPDKLVADFLSTQKVESPAEIQALWKDMSNELIKGCIHGHPKPLATEQFMFHKLLPGIYVGGTTDAIVDLGNGTVSIRDYKTASTKPSGISYAYRLQAHIYAFLATHYLGHKVSQIELQFVTRPTKTLPCRHFSFTEPFTEENLATITDQLQLIAESVDFWNKNPDLRYLLAQDLRLKPQPKKKPLFLKD